MIKGEEAMKSRYKLSLAILALMLLFPLPSSGEDNTQLKSEKMTPRERLETYLTLGEIYQKQKYPQKAITAYQKALKLDNRDPDIYKSLGKLYSEIKQFGNAAEIYQKALNLSPDDEMLTQSLAEAYRDSGNYDRAIELYKKLLNSPSNHYPRRFVFYGMIKTYQQAGKINELKNDTRKQIKEDPKNLDWYLLLGSIYQRENNWEKSIATYRQALEIDPDNENILSPLALACNMRDMYPEAAKYYER
ncbi:MAG TPA: tetratricopeptide repeat protein, partial [Proteobacteria bacterium]|nr:tetratricopeptide repeat protein [Pseudomonadota bacterium]